PIDQSNTTDSITTPTGDNLVTFGCVESSNLSRVTNLLTSQALTVTYLLPTDTNTANAFRQETTTSAATGQGAELHIDYASTVPEIRTTGATIFRVAVDGTEYS